ncbi:helix-turn-helix domain-containing protein [Luteibacter sp.]|jgi:hypothetical protein|uniref:helix-turn-helix domain-containing protein n=1 Tax=Luteibacter sp. TaxID=1886636 RepID=UPI002F419990
MNDLHAHIVRQFHAGDSVNVIARRLGFARNSVYRILRRNNAPAAAAAAKRYKFQSRPDGEYAECRGCVRRGYGEDAWHPATTEFWRPMEGRLYFNQCRACLSEVSERKSGFVSIAA